MRITIKGNAIEQLKEFRDKLAQAPKLVEKAADNVGEAFVDLVADCFEKQADPYGESWPEKVFDDGRAILVGNTTRLRRGWHVVKLGRGKRRVAPNVDYAKYHQEGTGLYGPHHTRIVPKNGKALAFYAAGYVSLSAARKVRFQAQQAFTYKGNGSIESRQKAFAKAGAKAVGAMKGSTVLFRSVKGAKPRRMLPTAARGLPGSWRKEIQDTVRDTFKAHFKK